MPESQELGSLLAGERTMREICELLTAWAQDEPHMLQSVRSYQPYYPNPAALRRDVRAVLSWMDETNEITNGLLADLQEQHALLRAVIAGGVIPTPEEAQAILALNLADYVQQWMPKLSRGTTLNKAHEMTLDQVREMADDVGAIRIVMPDDEVPS